MNPKNERAYIRVVVKGNYSCHKNKCCVLCFEVRILRKLTFSNWGKKVPICHWQRVRLLWECLHFPEVETVLKNPCWSSDITPTLAIKCNMKGTQTLSMISKFTTESGLICPYIWDTFPYVNTKTSKFAYCNAHQYIWIDVLLMSLH